VRRELPRRAWKLPPADTDDAALLVNCAGDMTPRLRSSCCAAHDRPWRFVSIQKPVRLHLPTPQPMHPMGRIVRACFRNACGRYGVHLRAGSPHLSRNGARRRALCRGVQRLLLRRSLSGFFDLLGRMNRLRMADQLANSLMLI